MLDIKKELPELPYDKKALAPLITEETFDYHYGKHHAAYVKNLNGLIKDSPREEKSVKELILEGHQKKEAGLFNNAAQHWNHSFFWHCLSPNGGGGPEGQVKELIERDFQSVAQFKEEFSTLATKLFGAGWAWLAQDESGKLEILPMSNAHTPTTEGKKPILTLDVWEHAYYIDYRNARPKFVESFWEIVNWDFANENLKTL
ncbi:superoxide dismutase [Fe] [Psychroflexus sp. S27]|uniref:superoxide dismutase n=1 Tax=Psychroflexus sp. S27 TaxID=1982757 RepID=UPI000C2988C8|nr:superoxide dismutase [Psychroflexus sp. S27]PJX28444.1 superoxide dismutase [Fe] [Psychroflexus sp. S27]